MQGKILNRIGHFGGGSGGPGSAIKAVDVLLARVGVARFRGEMGLGDSPG